MKSHLSTLFLCLDCPHQRIVRTMSIQLHMYDVADAVQMAHNVIPCGGTGKHSYTLQSVWLNESYEEKSGDCNSSIQTFLCTEFGMMCARAG